MKKLLISLLLVVMTLSLVTACSPQEASLYNDLNAAIEKTNNAKSYSMTMDNDISLDISGMSIDIPMNGVYVVKNDDNFAMQGKMTTSALGQEVSVELVYTDGVYYFDTMGMKMKQAMNLDEIQAQTNTQLMLFNENAIENATVSDVENGKKYSATLKSEAIEEYVGSLSSGISSSLGLTADELAKTMSISDIEAAFIVDAEGYVIEQSMAFDMNFEIEGQEVSTSMEMLSNFSQFGEDIAINVPANLDEYQDAPTTIG